MSEDAAEVLRRNRELLRAHKDSQESEQLLEKLPQGHGSGLNADTVDGLHAAEIMARAPGKGGGGSGSGGSGDMQKTVYDLNDNGVVDNSEKLNGHTEAQVQDHAPKEHGDEAHSLAYALVTELADHAALPDVHHAQAHTLASHSTKAHSELTGVTADQHHNQVHGDGDHSESYEKTGNKNAANGYAGLSASSKVAASQMPTAKITQALTWHIPDALTTGQKKIRLLGLCAMTLLKVRLVVDTAPTGANLIVDVHTGTGAGTTIFTTQGNRPTITAGNKTAESAAPDVTECADNTEFSVCIDQIGSTVAGADLTIELIYTQTVAFT